MVMRVVTFGLFIISIGMSQSKYPADSLLSNPEISFIKKMGILPIATWQRMSYNSQLLNCQFYPSCSNYGAEAIKQYGLLKGGAIASDRIVRCNPFAFHYHLKTNQSFFKDGRLMDPVLQNHELHSSKKSPWIAAGLSAIIPGAGRMYTGRLVDGLMGLWTFYLFGKSATTSIHNNKPVSGFLFGVATGFIYFGEMYGAWRSAIHINE